jgi:hypothetical protein
MKPAELKLTLGGYEIALSFRKAPVTESVPEPLLPVPTPVSPAVEASPNMEQMVRWSKGNLTIVLGCAFFIAGTLFIALNYIFPLNMLAAFYIFGVAAIVGLPHVVPRTPKTFSTWSDFAMIVHPQIFPWSSVAFAVLGALAALSASNERFSGDLRGFLNALAYLIPVIGLMIDANKSFSEAARRVLDGAETPNVENRQSAGSSHR